MTMTREEQIWDEACRRYADSKMRNAFVAAANWADAHPQWIPVEERLPDEEGRYIVHAERKIVSSTVCEAYYDGKFWYHHGSGAYLNVTHWMPLPQPPRKEDKR